MAIPISKNKFLNGTRICVEMLTGGHDDKNAAPDAGFRGEANIKTPFSAVIVHSRAVSDTGRFVETICSHFQKK